MHTDAFAGQATAVNGKLRLFSLYVDFVASAHARWAAGVITKLAGPRWQSSAEMWNLDALTVSEPIRKMITGDAADADVLIIAASSLDLREPKLIEWLDSLAAWKANHPVPGLLAGLFGDEENRSRELEWTIQQFIYCARQMGRELVVQWMERGSMADSGWLTREVEAFLARKQSACSEAFQREAAVGVGLNLDAERLVPGK
jgi:hypothetical protein